MRNNRIVWSDNGTLVDLSERLNDFSQTTKVIPFAAAQDYIYIGSILPFNHRHFEIKVANTAATSVSVFVWNNKTWVPAVDILDGTLDLSGGTKSLSRSGIISWEKDPLEPWISDDTADITGLTTLKITDLFWARLSWSNDWLSSTELTFIGHKFANDSDLAMIYPDLNRSIVKEQFSAGKTTWDDQHCLAAKIIVRDLKNQDYIWSGNQIIRWGLLMEASIHKVAEIIFISQGKDAETLRDTARKYYEESLKQINLEIDKNSDTHLSKNESIPAFTVVRR